MPAGAVSPGEKHSGAATAAHSTASRRGSGGQGFQGQQFRHGRLNLEIAPLPHYRLNRSRTAIASSARHNHVAMGGATKGSGTRGS